MSGTSQHSTVSKIGLRLGEKKASFNLVIESDLCCISRRFN